MQETMEKFQQQQEESNRKLVETAMQMADGSNSRLVNSYTCTNAQTNQCVQFQLEYSKTRRVYATIERTAGTVTDVKIGIVESND